jgi:glycosyltransferase involved in cell wall biosynthesis
MKFRNKTNNTVYLQDIDRHIPFLHDEPQQIDADNILKSLSFQQMVALGAFEIVSIDNTRIEKNLQRVQKQMATLRQKGNAEGPTLPRPNQLQRGAPTTVAPTPDRHVFIKGHFLEAGGYAKYNRNLAAGLKACGVEVAIEAVGNKNQLNELEARQLATLRGSPTKNSVRIDSMVPSFSTFSAGRNTVLYTTIESYTIPQQFIDIARQYREIWVTSDFCKEILLKHGINQPIKVMPCSINKNIYSPEGEKYAFRPELNKFVFVSVFGWSYRKGYDVLLRSYLNEFNGNDDVTLLLVSRVNNDSGKGDTIKAEVDKFIKESGVKNPPHIARCSKVIPEDQMPSLYRACNAFVLFSRGEGFGMPYCEASACGLPVIGTNCSGQQMFLKKDNSYLLDIDHLAKVDNGQMHVHYWDGQEFPSFKSQKAIEQAGKLMREVYENYDKAKKRNEKLREFVLSNYSIGNVTLRVKERLEQIWSGK